MDKLYFDLETTGADATQDRIVQLAVLVENEQGEIILNKQTLFNPEIPIKPSATEVHGITDAMIKSAPKFYDWAPGLKKLFENKILVTYNGIHFDIPILVLSFDRAGVEIELSGQFIDVFRIEKKLHSSNLATVYKKYTGKDLENAHDATGDIIATKEIREYQYSIHSLTDEQAFEMSGCVGMVDYFGKLIRDDKGFLVYNWGKHKGIKVKDEPAYVEWVIKENFPRQVKKLLVEEVNKHNFKKLKL